MYKALGSNSCRSLPPKKNNTIEPLSSSLPSNTDYFAQWEIMTETTSWQRSSFPDIQPWLSWCFYPKGCRKIAGITVGGTLDSQGNIGSLGTASPRQLSHAVQCDWDLGNIWWIELIMKHHNQVLRTCRFCSYSTKQILYNKHLHKTSIMLGIISHLEMTAFFF